jgi:hypothetical protein
MKSIWSKNMVCRKPRWAQSSLMLLLASGAAHAGVSYTIIRRDLTAPIAVKPTTTAYFARNSEVRVGGLQASRIILYKGGNIYSIDNRAHAVHVLKQATLENVREKTQQSMREMQQKLRALPSTASPAQRTMAQRLSEQTQGITERMLKPVTLQFQETNRSEKVDSGTCRIWDETENGAKHLEVCVTPIDRVSGGQELFEALGNLCHYYTGSMAALGIGFGLTDPWPAFSKLKGLPVRIRVFEKGRAVSQTDLTAIHEAAVPASLFVVPPAYKVDDRPLR